MKPRYIIMIAVWLFPCNALANCYLIKNQDNKNYCLARTKAQSSYCYLIKEPDSKNLCLAETLDKRSYCYNIRSADAKSHCLALVK
jgi:hypothetical protein